MPIFKFIGYLIAGLGVLCGLLLLLSPLTAMAVNGLQLAAKVMSLSVLFVFLSATGIVLAGFGGGGKAAVDSVLFNVGSAWLVLGVLAILALILDLIGVVGAGVTLIWWLMAAGCLFCGAVATMMGSKSPSPTPTADS